MKKKGRGGIIMKEKDLNGEHNHKILFWKIGDLKSILTDFGQPADYNYFLCWGDAIWECGVPGSPPTPTPHAQARNTVNVCSVMP